MCTWVLCPPSPHTDAAQLRGQASASPALQLVPPPSGSGSILTGQAGSLGTSTQLSQAQKLRVSDSSWVFPSDLDLCWLSLPSGCRQPKHAEVRRP